MPEDATAAGANSSSGWDILHWLLKLSAHHHTWSRSVLSFSQRTSPTAVVIVAVLSASTPG